MRNKLSLRVKVTVLHDTSTISPLIGNYSEQSRMRAPDSHRKRFPHLFCDTDIAFPLFLLFLYKRGKDFFVRSHCERRDAIFLLVEGGTDPPDDWGCGLTCVCRGSSAFGDNTTLIFFFYDTCKNLSVQSTTCACVPRNCLAQGLHGGGE